MADQTTALLVSSDWLSGHMQDRDIRILDATFKLPGATPTAREDYLSQHIPGAPFFDVDAVADLSSKLPHMLPTPAAFEAAARGLGISNDTHVIVYDGPGLMSAGRAWWTFRVYGHDKVSVLDGGLRNWIAEGRPTTPDVPTVTAGSFTARYRPELVRGKAEMVENLTTGREQIIDARPSGRFRGIDPEPRLGLRSGHIPSSLNLPSGTLTQAETGRMKSPEELRALFADSGLDLAKPITATCGSGVTAAALAFALQLIGKPDVAVYDGAWAEWGQPGDTPIATDR